MSEAKSAPQILVIARDAQQRRGLSAALTPALRVCERSPDRLGDTARLIDCAGAVVLLEGDHPGVLDALEPLTSLPAGRSSVLLLRDVSEELCEEALRRLAPAQVLTHPVPAALLRFAATRAFEARVPGKGARANHRRTPALLGVSSAIRGVLSQVKQVAPARIPVLILGETGTGKELVARAIHDQSPRSGGAFVAVNCGALPDTLLESELFGHRRGAFTGATSDRRGLFEEASGGTLFLDEIGDTSPALQVKLLRAIDTQEVRPLGDTRSTRVDVRLVSATNTDLEAGLEQGIFRQDLYYRINAVTIFVPPLRRRRVDIPFLAQHFAEEFGGAHARRITLDEEFLETLCRLEFRGNVRELRNAVERAIALADVDEPVSVRHLTSVSIDHFAASGASGGTLRERVEQVEIEAIRDALGRCDGNRTAAAGMLGLTRQGLRYKMRRLGLIGDSASPDDPSR